MAIAIDVADGAARFDGQKIRLDDITIPAGGGEPIPDQGRSYLSKTQHEAIRAIVCQVGDKCAGLLSGTTGNWQIARAAGQMTPFQIGCVAVAIYDEQQQEKL